MAGDVVIFCLPYVDMTAACSVGCIVVYAVV